MHRLTSAMLATVLSGLPAVAVACALLCAAMAHGPAAGEGRHETVGTAVSHHGHHAPVAEAAPERARSHGGVLPSAVRRALSESASGCPCRETTIRPSIVRALTVRVTTTGVDGALSVPVVGARTVFDVRSSSGSPPGARPVADRQFARSPVLRI